MRPVAVIGLSTIAPKSLDVEAFWDNIVTELDCITEVPPSRWKIEDYYDPDPTVPDKTYAKVGGFIPDVDFDPLEFGLPPNILEVTDTSQLLSLVVAKQAMIDAGYGDASEDVRERTGVILGVGGGQKLITPLTSRLQYPVWERVLASSGIPESDRAQIIEKMKKAYVHWEENSFPGLLGNVIAGRITNRLDLGGTNCVTDAACASSHAALKMAVTELQNRHTDMMITGGVDTDNSIFMYMSFSKTPAFSRRNEIRPFDVSGDGMLIGEAVAMLVLKRLEDAERDGDRIYAVIKGIGSSSDGRFKSIYAPRPAGQMLALQRAYDDAEVSPKTLGLVEAHGTGTAAGDVAEFSSLRQLFADVGAEKNTVALGTVKSQIGHTKAAAGAVSMVKAVLALHHKVLPPTINIESPNPKLEIEDSAFYLNTTARPWIQAEEAGPRRAGVSSFGFGGTNFHVVLEEYQAEQSGSYRMQRVNEIVMVPAQYEGQLMSRCQEMADKLNHGDVDKTFREIVNQSKEAIPANYARLGFVAKTAAEAREKLLLAVEMLGKKAGADSWMHPRGLHYRKEAYDTDGKVVALFAGQGAQYVDMGCELALNFPEVRRAFGKLDALFEADGEMALSRVTYPVPVFMDADRQAQEDELRQTQYAQPAIGALSAGMFDVLRRAGFAPDFTAGHSFGELSALWAAGTMDDETYFQLVRARGQAMSPPDDPNFDAGTMAAVMGNIERLEQDLKNLPDVSIANHNSPSQVVIAGTTPAIEQAQSVLEAKGYRVSRLAVSAAFHTSLVAHAQKDFGDAIEETRFRRAKATVFSNETAKPYPVTPSAIQNALKRQILEAVQFQQEIENLYDAGARVFVEFGPRSILTNLVKDILGGRSYMAVAMNASRRKDSDMQFRDAVVQLRVLGLELGDIDAYSHKKPEPPEKKRGMKVSLNAANYVSDKTRQAYEDALNDEHRVRIAAAQAPAPAPAPTPEPAVAAAIQTKQPAAEQPALPADIQADLAKLAAQRQELTDAHEHYLTTQSEHTALYETLLRQQQTLLEEKGEWITPEIMQPLSNSLEQLQARQQQIQETHEQYLSRQTSLLESLIQSIEKRLEASRNGSHDKGNGAVLSTPNPRPVVRKPTPVTTKPRPVVSKPAARPQPVAQPAAVKPAAPVSKPVAKPAPAPVAKPATSVASSVDVEKLSSGMLSVVSEKTGYPEEMLELRMDLEADLGIDSIKRVEILGEMQKRFPDLPEVEAEELAQLRTLGEIVTYMAENANGAAPAVPAVSAPVAQSAPEPSPAAETASSSVDVEKLSSGMLSVVSEKTGYPEEMLELRMDLEADLGIDSIKRVEILGEMQKRFPDLPEVEAEELAQLRTLGEIVTYMAENANGAAPAVAPAPAAPVQSAPAPVTPAAAETASPSVDVEKLSAGMLSVVSEKTGYPEEMLEPGMDLEADLGIDSIKRVEILGEMQKRFPDLPEVEAEELAQLRTLGEIVTYMAENANGAAPAAPAVSAPVAQSAPEPSPAAETASSSVDVEKLSAGMMSVVSEKTGYPEEMLEPGMDLEADLGIDSIKRVEILGEMQKRFPDLPEVEAEELAQLRTLGEIVTYMAENANGAAPAAPVVSAPPAQSAPAPVTPAAAETASSSVDVEKLSAGMMSVVSEKTGYPEEMLEPGMDLEADLGIDSIKRVEILGEMQKRFPDLPEVEAEELAQLRTLGEIVTYMAENASDAAPAVAPAPAAPVQSAPAPVTPAAAETASSSVDVEKLSAGMLTVVSEKTGYPEEMLEPGMDLEADLGIDSIKRVEILGEMQKRFPDLPEVEAEELAQLRTLGEIVTYMAENASDAAPAAPVVSAPPAQSAPAPVTPAAETASSSVDVEKLSAGMMSVVSEKTGYPEEMLEPGMDLEADLGIDSIKRVEILGEMQKRFPDLPEVEAEELAQLRTLGEIVTYMAENANGAAPAVPAVSAPVAQSAPEPSPAAETASSSVDVEKLSAGMMSVVSEKTGYPEEMLEPGMDLEADLGIDSIKRVEILGEMQKRFPDLPEVEAEELAQLRTLGEIVTYMAENANGAAPAAADVSITPLSDDFDYQGIRRAVVTTHPLPEPDFLDWTPEPGQVCLITSDGTARTTQLADMLMQQGWTVVVMSFPESSGLPLVQVEGAHHIVLDDMSEAHLKETLKAMPQRYGQVSAFIHLSPAGQHLNGKLLNAEETAVVKHVFLMAKYLKPALTQAAKDGRACFLTVTQLDGELGMGSFDTGAVSGGLYGLVKTLSREWEQVFCRAVDLSPAFDVSQAVRYIIAELHDPKMLITEVGYTRDGRMTLAGQDL